MVRVEKEFEEFLMGPICRPLLGMDAVIKKVSFLIDQHCKSIGIQANHLDWLLDGLVDVFERCAAIAPSTDLFSLLLFPGSHLIMREAARFHLWSKEWGFKFSTPERDAAFSRSLPIFEPTRLWLKKDQMLIFRGHLVHGGDESRVTDSGTVLPNPRWASCTLSR